MEDKSGRSDPNFIIFCEFAWGAGRQLLVSQVGAVGGREILQKERLSALDNTGVPTARPTIGENEIVVVVAPKRRHIAEVELSSSLAIGVYF